MSAKAKAAAKPETMAAKVRTPAKARVVANRPITDARARTPAKARADAGLTESQWTTRSLPEHSFRIKLVA